MKDTLTTSAIVSLLVLALNPVQAAQLQHPEKLTHPYEKCYVGDSGAERLLYCAQQLRRHDQSRCQAMPGFIICPRAAATRSSVAGCRHVDADGDHVCVIKT